MFSLAGKRALVVGIANEESIAYGCAKAFRSQGADLAITYLNDKAEPFVRPLAEKLGAEIVLPLDVQENGQFNRLFDQLRQAWGRIDICLHSIAFCPREDLHARVVDTSRDGFCAAMDISVHSFIRMVRHAEPMMPHGGTCMTVSFYGSEKVVEHYNVMGPVKAALESATRYMAAELGPKKISVHALSPGRMLSYGTGYDVPRTYPARGHYYALAGQAPFRHLVYPLPGEGWLGVHLTIDVAGRAKFGPDLEWQEESGNADAAPRYDFDGRGGQRLAQFERGIRRYWPGLPEGALEPSYVGVRPKIYRQGEPVPDFAIHGPRDHGMERLVALYGIESPGLTSALAIGEHVARMLAM